MTAERRRRAEETARLQLAIERGLATETNRAERRAAVAEAVREAQHRDARRAGEPEE